MSISAQQDGTAGAVPSNHGARTESMVAASSSGGAAPVPMFDFTVLRTLRKHEGLTLEEVADRAGLSPAVISKIERNQSRAELETLYKLGRVFGLTAADVLALAEARMAHGKAETAYRSGAFTFRRIQYSNLSVFLGEATKGGSASRREVHQDDYETCWVLSGRIRLSLPNEHYELGAGESIQFDAVQDHAYEALEDTSLLIVHVRKPKRF